MRSLHRVLGLLLLVVPGLAASCSGDESSGEPGGGGDDGSGGEQTPGGASPSGGKQTSGGKSSNDAGGQAGAGANATRGGFVGIGFETLKANASTAVPLAVGWKALTANTSGCSWECRAIGAGAFMGNTIGSASGTAMGYEALKTVNTVSTPGTPGTTVAVVNTPAKYVQAAAATTAMPITATQVCIFLSAID